LLTISKRDNYDTIAYHKLLQEAQKIPIPISTFTKQNMATGESHDIEPTFDIPKECKAGVVCDEGPNFHMKVEMVPVPEPGMTLLRECHFNDKLIIACK